MNIPTKEDLRNKNKKCEKYIKSHYSEFHQWIVDTYPWCKSWSEVLYCYINKVNVQPICRVCGNPVNFQSTTYGYSNFCSSKCVHNDKEILNKTKQTNLERYGVVNPSQTEKFKEKVKQTNLERYGVECSAQSKEAREKAKQTNLKRYGVEHPLASDEIKKKIKQTNLKRYGRESFSQTEKFKEKLKLTNIERHGGVGFSSSEIKEKVKQTNLERYGVENAMQNKDVRKKAKQTNLKRYGVENPSQSDEIKEKAKQTNLKRYGVENPSQAKEIREKVKQISLKKYGVECSLQADSVKEKSKQTNLERYGVPYYCMAEDCRKSGTNDSRPNRNFADLLESSNIIYNREFHLYEYSYDFKVGNTLIEINPTPTHNSTWGIFNSEPKTNRYHLDKSKTANESGFNCIHIWDWDDPLKMVQLIAPKETIYARKCSIKEITIKEANKFLNQYHLQGRCNGQKVCISLIYNNEYVGLMTFGKPRYNKKFQWELLRLCFSKNIIGGSERLFKYFISHYNPESIISYCDKSKFSGAVYKRLGFALKSTSGPSKHWYNIKTKQHITDNLLRQRGFDQLFNASYGKGTSNEQLMLENGFVEVYDCGQDSYEWMAEH